MGFSQNEGYRFGGPYNTDYSILGSRLGSPYFGKLPDVVPSVLLVAREPCHICAWLGPRVFYHGGCQIAFHCTVQSIGVQAWYPTSPSLPKVLS